MSPRKEDFARHTTELEIPAFDDTAPVPNDWLPIDNLPAGYVLEGRYEVRGLLGRGGFGVVYEALQRTTGQRVAVKVLLNKENDGVVQARFAREMALIARLNHPHIVRLIDSGRLSEGPGHLFAVLELIEGESLAERLKRSGPLGVALARRLMTQALEALAYAHKQGVIHRDLKPQNIMVTGSGALAQARVLDFGLAAVSKEARAEDYLSLTGTHQIQGTPGYMSPEQLTNGELTPRIDLYAMGLVFVECLLGEPMIQASSLAAMIFLQLSKEQVALPDALRATPLGPLLAAMTAKSHTARPASAEAVLAALAQLDWQHPSFAAFEAWVRARADEGGSGGGGASAVGLTDEALRTGSWFDSANGPPPMVSGALSRRAGGAWVWVGVVCGGLLLAVAAWWVLRSPTSTEADAAAGAAANMPAPAPACPLPGQVLVLASQCCWPGQRWDDLASACKGTPTRCPPERYADGADCVPLAPHQRSTATLSIAPTDPPGALVVINGAEMGAAPLSLEGLPLGDFSITYRMSERAEARQFIALDRDKHTATLPPATLPPLDPGVPPDMVWVPAGPSWRGCVPTDDEVCEPSERPGAEVTLPSFAIDRAEVTVADYRRCVDAGGCAAPAFAHTDGSGFQSLCSWGHPSAQLAMHPMNCVTWGEARAYCTWRGRRLPTSAEWEKAARGPQTQAFPWGNTPPDCDRAIIQDPRAGDGCGRGSTWPVASRPLGASPYGALDMVGNVEEWTDDRFAGRTESDQPHRTVHGGGYDDALRKLRLSRQDDEEEGSADNDLGFRCALTVPPSP